MAYERLRGFEVFLLCDLAYDRVSNLVGVPMRNFRLARTTCDCPRVGANSIDLADTALLQCRKLSLRRIACLQALHFRLERRKERSRKIGAKKILQDVFRGLVERDCQRLAQVC